MIDAQGWSRFALIGLSGGGTITLRYGARHPERVSRLVLMGGFARGMLHRDRHAASAQLLDAMARLIEEGWGQDTPAFRRSGCGRAGLHLVDASRPGMAKRR